MNRTRPSILVMAGGTGGHVFPALATARVLREKGFDIFWLGTQNGIEADVVPKQGFPIHFISAVGVRGKKLKAMLLAPFQMLNAMLAAVRLIRNIQPVSVLGMGGYVTVPGGLAAVLLGKPLVIHEQNAIPGSANKLLSRFAKKVCCGFSGAFAGASVVGNPVRAEIARLAVEQSPREGKRLLVLGGSLGALALNRLLPEALAKMQCGQTIEVRHQCGRAHLDLTQQAYRDAGIEASVEAFVDDMASAYAWADLVVCRAGALTVAEVMCAGLPAIFVPYPYAIDDHQTANAKVAEAAGAGVVMQQAELDASLLARTLDDWLQKPEQLQQMASKARQLAKPDAAEKLAGICVEVARAEV